MTNKEREMYEILRQNPQISQNELAEKLGITRSSVSVHITNLTKKGYIAGRGYILNESDYVVVVGAANIDILGTSYDGIIAGDSNPGRISFCPGGVSRNIAENLARLQVDVKMISALGSDAFGDSIVKASEEAGIDMSHCYLSKAGTTSTYLAIIGNDGDMHVALSDMSALDGLPVEHIQRKRQLIHRSKAIVTDACLPEEVVEYILTNFRNKPIFMDAVSVGKTRKIRHQVGRFHTLKCNGIEAGHLAGMPIDGPADCEKAAAVLLEQGVGAVYITLGEKGVYYSSRTERGYYRINPLKPVNATGAGDAFMAGIVYCYLQGKSMEESARFASAMSAIALKSDRTVSTGVSPEAVLMEMR